MSAPVVLEPYDRRWPVMFERERMALAAAGGSLFTEIHHVGSTSIPGIAAKPVIDILIVLDRYEDGVESAGPMQAIGYEYRGANGIEGRHYFNKGKPHTHHVHMLARGHPEAARLLRFRDHLREHPDEASAYEALKRRLAQRFGADRRSYTASKAEFCDRIDRLSANR